MLMAYTLSEASNRLSIKEQEYASAAEIKFTMFTSCIGVIAKKGGTLTAVHLVMKSRDDSLFDSTAAANVLALLPKSPDAVTIFGCCSLWENPQNNVLAGFQKLTGSLSSVTKYQQYTFGEGEYGAQIDGSDIEITY
jgi:hypothetical protein